MGRILRVAQAAVDAVWSLGRKSSGGPISHPEQLWLQVYGSRESKSGVSVTVDTALQVSTALACVRVISEDTASLPCPLIRVENGRRSRADDHPVAALLNVRANDWQTGMEFRETLTMHAALCHGGFAFKNMVRGRVAELIPLLPQRVEVKQDPRTFALTYEYRPEDAPPFVIPRDQILHLRGPSWNGFTGLQMLRLAREALGLSLALEEHSSRLHSNGARPGGILTTEQHLKAEQVKEIKEAWDRAVGGLGNAFNTAVMTGGMKFVPMAMTGVDAQTIEQRVRQVEEVCRFFRVSPTMVWQTDKTATYASAEQFFLAHVKYTVLPWCRRWEGVIRRDLLGENERNIYPKHNLAALERADIKTRYTAYGQAIKDGWMTRNEARELEDRDPLDGLDTPLRPLNMGDGSKPPSEEDDPREETDDE